MAFIDPLGVLQTPKKEEEVVTTYDSSTPFSELFGALVEKSGLKPETTQEKLRKKIKKTGVTPTDVGYGLETLEQEQKEEDASKPFSIENIGTFGIGGKGGSFGVFTEPLTDSVSVPEATEQRILNKIKDSDIKELIDGHPFEHGTGAFVETQTSALITPRGQLLYAFSDTPENLKNALDSEDFFTPMPDGSKREYRVIQDDEAGLFVERNYISVQNDDGSWTPFSAPIQSMDDFVQGTLKMFGAEIGLDIATTGPALATTSAIMATAMIGGLTAAVTVPLAVVYGMYSLYVAGKGQAKAREAIKTNLGLNEEEVDGFIDAMSQLENKSNVLVPGGGNTTEEITGIANALFSFIPGIKQVAGNFLSNVRTRFLQKQKKNIEDNLIDASGSTTVTFKSAVEAKEFTATNGGLQVIKDDGTAEVIPVGQFLKPVMVTQMFNNKIANRLASLAEQTTIILPNKVREQMLSVTKYLRTVKDAIGEGAFDTYRKNIDDLEARFRPLELAPDGTVLQTSVLRNDIDTNVLNTTVGELNTMFIALRRIEARGLYNNIFKKLETKSYVLGTVDDEGMPVSGLLELLKNTRMQPIPVNKLSNTKIEAGFATDIVDESNALANIIDDLSKLGKLQKDKKTVLFTPFALKRARQIQEKYGYIFNEKDQLGETFASPAEVLHLYAVRLGELGANTNNRIQFLKDNPGQSVGESRASLIAQAQKIAELRKGLLDLISNFKGSTEKDITLKNEIKKDLLDANSFYQETKKITNFGDLLAQRANYASSNANENIPFTEKILGFGGKDPKQKSGAFVETLSRIKKMEEYVNDALGYSYRDGRLVKTGDARVTLSEQTEAMLAPTFRGVPGSAKLVDKQAYSKIREAWIKVVSHKLADTASEKGIIDDSTVAAATYIRSFDESDLKILGITKEIQDAMVKDAVIIAQLKRYDFPKTMGTDLSLKTDMVKYLKSRVFNKEEEIETNLSKIIALNSQSANPIEANLNLKTALSNYLMSVESGAFRRATKNSAYEQIGDIIPEPAKFMELVELFSTTPSIKKLYSKEELDVFRGLANYSAVVQGVGADAGSALSGAQLVANVYTLNPGKFIAAVGRIVTQRKVAQILSDPRLTDVFTGQAGIDPSTFLQRNSKLFIGRGVIASVLADVALEQETIYNIRDTRSEENRLNFKSGTEFKDPLGVVN